MLAVLAPFILALFIPALYKYVRQVHTGWFVLPLPVILFAFLFQYIPGVANGEPYTFSIPWAPSLGINFTLYVDGWSLLFGLLITGIGALVVLYSIYYLYKDKEALNTFYVYLLMFMGAMLGVVFSDNMVVLYVFWELTSLSSFLLIGYWYHREKSIYGAQKSTIITIFGGFAMLAGFAMMYVMTGTFSIRETIAMAGNIVDHQLFIPAMIMILLGAFTKSAQFPFHIWLPDAMEAPTPISAYLHSATMVKAGLYLVGRMTPIFAGIPEWFWIVSSFGIFTLLWGSFSAVKQTDLKSILAYSTISQLGLIMSLLGLGSAALYFGYGDESLLYTTAILAAVFHLFNHATFKGSLFMVVGIIDHETGTRDIRKLGGLMTIMPATFTLAVIGSAAMAGLPPFNGFLSKEYFFTGVVNASRLDIFNMDTWGMLFPVIAWVASVFTFIYCATIVFKTFTGKLQREKLDKEPHEAPIGMLIPPIVLASLVVITGFFPSLLEYTIIEPAMAAILPGLLGPTETFYVNIYFWHGWTIELFMTIGVVVMGTLMYNTYKYWDRIYFFMEKRDPVNNVYDNAMIGLVKGSTVVTRIQMTGLLRDYFTYMITFMLILLTYSLIRFDAIALDTSQFAPISIYLWAVTLVIVISTIAIPFIQQRVTAIIAVGAIGFMLALLFVVLRAPDLALTQLLVETVMVVLFLLCFYHLPELRRESFTPIFKFTNLVISIAVGVVITITAYSALTLGNQADFQPISQYFIENSYKLAGGLNMVNVILVDFRGLDTLLEVLVLGIAALGVVTMIKLRMTGREDV
ncbi:Na+/H+ antiporter subunit A [Desulfuribacillus alkaliarsenatis]|uniref:Na+/H+ antiporter subunit A n=1 Tax=Desulfuribacillus alkaliarsenatis TaxID=766136 RepID=A0A1E5G0K8_9FIRM|nr:Na+/H+ antiporter subunit A [Desulfuribacillus alkaliarsenatis]OEF96377.1 Na+/H+ antiporter subunit A [Desulfuribacillus alkaliarsenatis]